ncbi:MFS-type transporter SLC18B1 [Trichoplax sp. H2]|nr:MFS-type transporter SLC18B1 [Trichoplax sp. H2]|eukprot:RDD42100.1 MFS-type transporter SLC18B1 [Trichoplax sp. H2]
MDDLTNKIQDGTANKLNLQFSRRKKIIILGLLSIISFLVTTMFAVLAPFFPTVAKNRNVNQFTVGLIFAVYPATNFLFSFVCGLMMPHIGAVFVLCIGILIESCCSIIFGFLPHILNNAVFVGFCIITRAFQGTGLACVQTASLAITSSIFSENIASATSVIEVLTALGYTAGPTVGGLLYQAGGFKLPFLVIGSTMLIVGFTAIFFLPTIKGSRTSAPGAIMKKLLIYPRIILMCCSVTLLMILFGSVDLGLALHIKPFHLSPVAVGLLFLPLSIGHMVFSPVFGFLSDRFGYRQFVIGGCFAIGIAAQFVGPAPYLNIPLSIAQIIPSLFITGTGTAAVFTPAFGDILASATMNSGLNDDDNEETVIADNSNFSTVSVVSGIFTAFSALGENGDETTTTPEVTSKRNKLIIMVLLSVTYFLLASVYALLAPFFPQEAKNRNVKHFEIGLIFAIYPFFIFLISPICGIMMPRIGVVFTLWAGLFFEAGCSILFGFLPNILDHQTFVAFCLLIRGMQGIGAACSQTAALAMMSSIFPDNVATTTSTLEIFGALGFMTGPPIGGLLFQAGGFKLPFIVLGSTLLVIGCVVIYFIPRISHAASAPPVTLMKQLLIRPRVIIMCIGIILQMLLFGFLDPTLSLHLQPLNLTPPELGAVFLALGAGYGIFSPIFGWLSDRFGYRPFIIGGNFAMGVALMFLGPAPFFKIPLSLPQTILSLISLGIAAGAAAIPLYADMLDAAVTEFGNQSPGVDETEKDFVLYAVVSGLFSSASSLGQVLGPIVGGTFTSTSDALFRKTSAGIGFAVAAEGLIVILLTLWEKLYKKKTERILRTNPMKLLQVRVIIEDLYDLPL